MGFIKFALLATTGEIIALKTSRGAFNFPHGMLYKMVVWGFIGIGIALMVPVYSTGVSYLQQKGSLPGKNNKLVTAFFSSLLNNLTFGTTMMGFHTLIDTIIDLKVAKEKISLREVVNKTGWEKYIGFTILKTVPIFWIPAHTITYILPSQYRVIFSALLSIALGLILALGKQKNKKE
jgi:hypothetical protein